MFSQDMSLSFSTSRIVQTPSPKPQVPSTFSTARWHRPTVGDSPAGDPPANSTDANVCQILEQDVLDLGIVGSCGKKGRL